MQYIAHERLAGQQNNFFKEFVVTVNGGYKISDFYGGHLLPSSYMSAFCLT